MAGKWDGTLCSTCGVGRLRDAVRRSTSYFRGQPFVAMQSGAYCDNCDDGMVYYDPATDDAFEQFCRDVELREQRELAEIRGRLGLTQEEASKISGGGHNAFSRYERGEAQPVMAVVNLFRLLGRYPSLLRELIETGPAFTFQYTASEAITVSECVVTPPPSEQLSSTRIAVPSRRPDSWIKAVEKAA